MTTLVEIGAYEAKTHLADVLRKVRAGQQIYRITQRGEPVADLIPAAMHEKRAATEAATRMLDFMRAQVSLPAIDAKALIAEGRD